MLTWRGTVESSQKAGTTQLRSAEPTKLQRSTQRSDFHLTYRVDSRLSTDAQATTWTKMMTTMDLLLRRVGISALQQQAAA